MMSCISRRIDLLVILLNGVKPSDFLMNIQELSDRLIVNANDVNIDTFKLLLI
jgi:hypothetical protein